MMTSRLFNISTLFLLVCYTASIDVFGQCSSQSEPNCPTSGYDSVGNNSNINSGQTWRYNGTSNTYSNVNFNGGTLYVCAGSLTLSSFNFNSGTIYIKNGATLILQQDMYMNGSCGVYNFGTFTTTGNLTLQNSNNTFMNASSTATVNVMTSSKKVSINGSSCKFINYGTANLLEIQTSSSNDAGAVCLAPNSTLNVTNFSSNRTNVYSAPTSDACLKYTGTATLNSAMASNSNMQICKGSGASVTGSGGWGSASVTSNCSNCTTVLPVDLLFFKGKAEVETVQLSWATASEENNDKFELFRSDDGVNWISIGRVDGAGNSFTTLLYQFSDMNPGAQNVLYYKLQQFDFDGGSKEFTPIVVLRSRQEVLTLHPNPAHDRIQFNQHLANGSMLQIKDLSGRVILEREYTQGAIDISELSKGTYLIGCHQPGLPAVFLKFVKED